MPFINPSLRIVISCKHYACPDCNDDGVCNEEYNVSDHPNGFLIKYDYKLQKEKKTFCTSTYETLACFMMTKLRDRKNIKFYIKKLDIVSKDLYVRDDDEYDTIEEHIYLYTKRYLNIIKHSRLSNFNYD